MPYVVVDYSRCDGNGACISSCPGSVFELSGNRPWCKPADVYVKNDRALDAYREHVLPFGHAVRLAIRYHIPICYLCWQCIGACPTKAIDVEYDDVDIREVMVTVNG